jgi:hypothetical protein
VDVKEPDNPIWLMPIFPDPGFGVQFRGDHIYVKLGKDFKRDPERPDKFWNLVRKACEEHSSHRVLVEGFVPAGDHGTAEVVAAGQRTATVPNLWLAFCFANFEPTGQSELFEAIAAASGVRVKFFTDTDRALKWLRQNSPQ